MTVAGNILEAIGNTPLVQLRKIVPPGSGRILVKLEGANPTGNMKDRMAKAAIEAAEASGRLRPGMTVVEYTSGSTGAALALVCAAKGYKLHIVTSDAFSEEKIRTMRAFGAQITCIPSENKAITEKLVKSLMETAQRISQQPDHWWFDQFSNRDGPSGHHGLGEEIWQQTGGKVDAFVQCAGSAHALHGVASALRKHKADIHIAAAEPAESAVLSGRPKGAHKIEGVGIGFVPPLWKPEEVDEIVTATTEAAYGMCRRLTREEGIFAGSSSGLNVIAALQVAKRLGPGATVVTLMVDSGLRYLSTNLHTG